MRKKLIVAMVVGLGFAIGATQAQVTRVDSPATGKKSTKATTASPKVVKVN